MQNRWLISDMNGVYQRIDDLAMHAQMKMRGIKKKRQKTLLVQMMMMESAALELLNNNPAENKI